MLSILAHGRGMLSSAVIADDDDRRCGLCFGEGGYTPMAPPHEYAAHLLVELPAETYEIITDRYVLFPLVGGDERAWAAGLETCVAWLEANGYTVRAMRRQFHALADASS